MSMESCDNVDNSHGHDGNNWDNGSMCDKEVVRVETTDHDGNVGWEGCDSVEGDGSMHHAISRPCNMRKRRSCGGEMNKIGESKNYIAK